MKKRLTIVIPIMIIVALASNWLLGEQYAEIPAGSKTMLIIGGALLSGVISFFLFKEDER
ncbi:histidine kinase [Bacillus sp. KH172YL63]|uniref:histidine kinase n=1 Tax=Bacillus sp. KH172YL63 TaxID=2709784 RepID=UPI0013E4CB51|nr:histidine kinase [Bacillus sp. KH172YL63]BCB02447.1 hypothetical protein KH172YL63_05800 [Bacillus sp. KH172YL63]